MVRPKVQLTYIKNDAARRVTYKKRVKSLLKQTEELSVLCDVDACVIVHSPYHSAPVVWPSNKTEAQRVVMRYKGDPDVDQTRKNLTQKTFLGQSVTKSKEKSVRLMKRIRESEMENVMVDLLMDKPIEHVPFGDIGDLTWVIEDKIRSMQHRLRVIEGPDNSTHPVELIHQTGPSYQARPPNLFGAQAGPSHQAGPSYPFQYQHQPW